MTGRGGDFIIIDDPTKPEEANSDSTRKKANDWFQSTLFSRLDDKKRSVMIIVMQRLHVNDLTGFAQDGGGFKKLSFPAIATGDASIPVSATETYYRKDGEPLHAEYEDLNTLERIRNQIGTYNFVSQYQQSPETPSGGLIKRKYIHIIDHFPKIRPDGYWWSASTLPCLHRKRQTILRSRSAIPTATATLFSMLSAGAGITKC